MMLFKFRQLFACLVVICCGLSGWGLWYSGTFTYLLALSGDPAQQFDYGVCLSRHERYQDSLTWMEMAGAVYEPRALTFLGIAYQGGNGYMIDPDMEASFAMLHEAAERKYAPAMYMVGSLYENWKELQEKDKKAANAGALTWYMRAAQGGVGPAIDRMVKVYENGELGMAKSSAEADFWRKLPRVE